MKQKPLKIVYLTPALYMAGGVERVLTLKANYFVEHFGYDITIILTEGKDKPLFYPLSDKVKVVNLNIFHINVVPVNLTNFVPNKEEHY
jgi:hypothetical protein